jgi:hypothetical protein
MCWVVNTTVFSSNVKKTLLPWTILQIQEEEYTFIDFFNLTIKPRIEDCELVSAHIGPQKGSLDPVDSQLLIQPTVASFGRFIKFSVDSRITNEGREEASVSNPPPLNAFVVLMFAARCWNPRPAVIESYFVQKVKVLLCDISYKDGMSINVFQSTSSEEINEFWSALMSVDATTEQETKYNSSNLSKYTRLCAFMDHCCQIEHYTFDILKCGEELCSICKPDNLFNYLLMCLVDFNIFLDPSPDDGDHYLSFAKALTISTTGEHRPSLTKKTSKSSSNTLPFYASVQHVRNAQIVVQCDNCDMWRLIFSKYKLKIEQREYLQQLLSNLSYTCTCGSQLSDLNLPVEFDNVEIRVHQCGDIIEKLYYSAKYEPICAYCGVSEPYSNEQYYPQCQNCATLPPLRKK